MKKISTSKVNFAAEAVAALRADPELQSYATGEIESGELLALRWNKTCILVIEVGIEEPCLFTDIEEY